MARSELFGSVLTAFREAGWDCAEVEGREVARAGFEAHHGRVELHVQAFPPISAVSVVSESTRHTDDPARRDRLAELAMRVNQMLTVGNFELDWDAGRLMFRVTNLFPDPAGEPSIVQHLIHTTIGEMDRIAPVESMILQADGPDLPGLDLEALLRRDDLLPEAPAPDSDPL